MTSGFPACTEKTNPHDEIGELFIRKRKYDIFSSDEETISNEKESNPLEKPTFDMQFNTDISHSDAVDTAERPDAARDYLFQLLNDTEFPIVSICKELYSMWCGRKVKQ